MDLVVRQICVEPGKSRLPGLLPYIGGENGSLSGNFAQFIYNIDFTHLANDTIYGSLADMGIMSYRSMIYRYHWMERFFKKCTYYTAVIKNGSVTWTILPNYTAEEQYFANLINEDLSELIFRLGYTVYDMKFLRNTSEITRQMAENNLIVGVMENMCEDEYTYDKFMHYGGMLFYKFVEKSIGKILVPEEIKGSLVPNYIYLTDIADFKAEMLKMKAQKTCCDNNRYMAMGGDEMVAYLNNFDKKYIEKELAYFSNLKAGVPNINITLSLNYEYDDMGVMQLVDQEFIPGYFYNAGDSVFFQEETYICLKKIDESNYAEGSDIKNGEFWLRKAPQSPLKQEMINYIGESLLRGLRVFKRSYSDDGIELPGILHEGSNDLEFPYRVGLVKNAYTVYGTYDETVEDTFGDTIYNIERDATNMTYRFQYVIGGKMRKVNGEYEYEQSSQTGILYDETYQFITSAITATVDGFERTFTYDYIDFDSYEVKVDSIGKGVIFSNMNHLLNSIFGESIYNGMNQTYSGVYRNELDFGLSDKKIWNTSNIEVDRGVNSAFEKHFKLFEVNTMDDLTNYQNNYFGLGK